MSLSPGQRETIKMSLPLIVLVMLLSLSMCACKASAPVSMTSPDGVPFLPDGTPPPDSAGVAVLYGIGAAITVIGIGGLIASIWIKFIREMAMVALTLGIGMILSGVGIEFLLEEAPWLLIVAACIGLAGASFYAWKRWIRKQNGHHHTEPAT